MKKFFAAALAICLLFCGCGVIKENNERGEYIPTSEIDIGDSTNLGRVEKSAVYFLNKTSDTLTAELRTLVIKQDANPAEAAVEELILGPSNEDLKRVAPDGMSLDFIEFSRDVANVYLKNNGQEMAAKDKFILELALANTITDILGATYISVFYDGIQTGLSGVASAPQKKQTGSIEEAWAQAQAKYFPETLADTNELAQEGIVLPSPTATEQETEANGAAPQEQEELKVNEITTILYFVSENGGYILPEVRNVVYTDDDYITSLINELKIGPQDKSLMKSPLAQNLQLLESEFIDIGGGEYRLKLNFSKRPTQYDFSGAEDSLLSYAALIYTITGFVPDIISVDLLVMGKRITSIDGLKDFTDGMQRQDYTGYIGSSVPLYLADKDSDLLLEVSRSMEQEKTWSAYLRVLEIIKGPLAGDPANARPIMLYGVSAQDILSVEVYEDIAYVNLSQNFKDAYAEVSSKTEMQLIYAIVNTVTSMDGINKVQFLIEGKQTEKFAGYLCLSDPFLKNYGIVKKSG